MSARPELLFYCQHSLGMGHLVRAFELARALSEAFNVVFLNGGRMPASIAVPDGVTVVDLPPLGMDEASQLVSLDERYSVVSAKAERRRRIMSLFQTLRPAVILVELFPFGRKKFADELMPLLEAARAMGTARPRIVCSLRDILVGSRHHQQRHDDRAAHVANAYFDAVLVHADPAFVSLDESFRPSRPLQVPVHYTGFVTSVRRKPASAARERCVVVSAGGGMVGAPLLRTAIEAHKLLGRDAPFSMRLVAGPFLPNDDWRALQVAALGVPGLEVVRSVSSLRTMFDRVAASVSQCGYNTAMEILASGVPALVVPFAEGREDEQMNRARRLEHLGLLRVLEPTGLNAHTLADALYTLATFQPRPTLLDLDGARRSTLLLARLVADHTGSCRAVVNPQAEAHLDHLA